jgi:hypothetical protein
MHAVGRVMHACWPNRHTYLVQSHLVHFTTSHTHLVHHTSHSLRLHCAKGFFFQQNSHKCTCTVYAYATSQRRLLLLMYVAVYHSVCVAMCTTARTRKHQYRKGTVLPGLVPNGTKSLVGSAASARSQEQQGLSNHGEWIVL